MGTVDAVLAEHPIEHRILAGKRSRVRGRSLSADRGAPNFGNDHRLARGARCRKGRFQFAAVATAFHVAEDHIGAGVLRQPGHAIGKVHVALVARCDPVA